MFNDILVPLDGSELSERALPIAQDLAQSSEATVHLIHMVSREHELGAGRGIESVQAAEMELDMARRLTESQLHRGRIYLEQQGSQLSGAGIKIESEFAVKAGNPAHQSLLICGSSCELSGLDRGRTARRKAEISRLNMICRLNAPFRDKGFLAMERPS